LEKSVLAGTKVEDKQFVVLTELLMVQLLKLDGIEAEGEARAQRKAEVQWSLNTRSYCYFWNLINRELWQMHA
jgi:hypothetical protein